MYTMKESVAVAKEADAKKGVSPTRSDNSIHCVRDEPEMQLGSLRSVIGNIRRDGGTPSVESIATQLSGMSTGGRAPALLALQQTHGNRYVQRVVAGIQAKLVVGQPNDKCEQEADRVADVVMRMPEPQVQRQPEVELLQTKPLVEQITPLVQRQVEEEAEEEEEEKKKKKEEEEILQAKEIPSQTPEVTPNMEARINALRGGGQPLPESVSAFFEPRFGHNFSHVRVHIDTKAAESARAVNALAYTVGRDIAFSAGQYAPATTTGKRLLAHELTHVVQQGYGAGGRIQRRGQKESGTTGVGGTGAGAHADPCGGSSKAASYTPTDRGIRVSLGRRSFGNTSKLAAHVTYGACRAGGNWRFHIDTLTVRIASAVRPVTFRTNVNTSSDPVVSSSTYQAIKNDLRPNRAARIQVRCAGNTFIDNVPTYSRRSDYWKHQLVVDHEAYHRQDWNRFYRPELVQAEQQVWGHRPTSPARTSADAIRLARPTFNGYIASAYQRTCRAYAPQQETRAYGAGAPDYQRLVSEIQARAHREGW